MSFYLRLIHDCRGFSVGSHFRRLKVLPLDLIVGVWRNQLFRTLMSVSRLNWEQQTHSLVIWIDWWWYRNPGRLPVHLEYYPRLVTLEWRSSPMANVNELVYFFKYRISDMMFGLRSSGPENNALPCRVWISTFEFFVFFSVVLRAWWWSIRISDFANSWRKLGCPSFHS